MKIRISPDAENHIHLIDAWWRENRRDSPNMFADELGEALARIESLPWAAPSYAMKGRVKIRRSLLQRTRVHIYFAIDDAQRIIDVVAVWGAIRGCGPNL